MKVELSNLPARLRLPLMDMLKSLVGREMQGRTLDSGIPGQVVRMQLGGQTIRALLQGRGVQEGQTLNFRVEQKDGQFFLKLLGKGELDPAAESNSALRDFVMKLGTERLQFFQSLDALMKYWKQKNQSRPGQDRDVQTESGPTKEGTQGTQSQSAVVASATGDSESEEWTALASVDGPAFWAMTASLPDHPTALFVFYADTAEYLSVRLLVVQPDDDARADLQNLVDQYSDPSIQDITLLSRFPDPSFFQTGQLWEA
ncbi:MAG: hypothetical protein RH862_18200 [Leptospiraceae bacterium]